MSRSNKPRRFDMDNEGDTPRNDYDDEEMLPVQCINGHWAIAWDLDENHRCSVCREEENKNGKQEE